MTSTTTVEQTTQVYQVFIQASPDRVWDAITKPEFTERYFYGTRASYDLRPGGRYLSVAADDEANEMVDGEVVELDPPHRLVQTWRFLYDPELQAEGYTRVTWEIEEGEGGVTKLTVSHDLESAPKTAEHVAGGWMFILSGLKTLLETGRPLAG
jgi:uncharacterized protein YndB with AHSA1/START domain